VIQDYLNLWTRNIQTLLDKLRDTIPSEGMIGEVHYWRDMSRILDAINEEVKQTYVEICVQVRTSHGKDEAVDKFTKEKNRVIQGAKEAKWNNKYMKVIEKPVSQIEQAKELKDIQVTIVVLLKSLKNIYENSNFYKEARIVSFIDRILDCIVSKIKMKMTITLSVTRGLKDYEVFLQDVTLAQSIL
jgi:Dynein heavy chain, N-terminal region 1